MAVLTRLRYDYDGDLLQVRESDIRGSHGGAGGTVDPGFYHLETIIAGTEAERRAMTHRFNDRMQAVPGYRLLAVLPVDIEGGGPGSMAPAGFVRFMARVVYAIERQ